MRERTMPVDNGNTNELSRKLSGMSRAALMAVNVLFPMILTACA